MVQQGQWWRHDICESCLQLTTFHVEVGRVTAPHGETVLSLIIESPTERRCPVQLVLTLPDGSGGGGGNKGTLDAPSVEGTIDSTGNLWLFGAIPKDCSQVRYGANPGHLLRQPCMSLDFYLIDIGVDREGDLIFSLGDQECRRAFST